MEVWWADFIARPVPLMVMMVFTFLLLLGYNSYSGVRPDRRWSEIMIDSVEEMGIGFIISFLVLLMLDRIQLFYMHINEIMGKTVIEAMAVSIGVSIGKSQLGGSSDDQEKGEQQQKQQKANRNSMWGIAALAVCGSIIVGSNVAPIQEILMLGMESEPIHILAMALFSVLISVMIVYFSDFKGAPAGEVLKNKSYTIIFGTAVCYLIALATSAFLLWFFGRFDNMSLWGGVAQVIVLGYQLH